MKGAKKPAAHYLGEMTRFATMVNFDLTREAEAELAAQKRYVRINGGGIRVVSLCSVSPCGRISGHNTVKTLSGVRRATQGDVPKPGKGKPEQAVQASVIEHAKRWPEALPDLLHLSDLCDELRFVNDELAVDFISPDGSSKSIRADVVLAGRKGDVWFPVFVELKNDRMRGTLLKQLTNAADALTADAEACEAFVAFLRASARLNSPQHAAQPVDVRRTIKLFIWPRNPGPEQFHELDDATFAIEFQKADRASFRERYDAPVLKFTKARKRRDTTVAA